MPRKLTGKQEAYKNARIEGNKPSASYDIAYPDHKMSRNAVSKEAAKLEKDPRIAPVIDEKRREASEKALVTTQELVQMLLAEAKGEWDDSTPSSRGAALKTLTDFTGGFDANKQNLHHSGAVDLSGKTDAELAAIIAND
jgi:phage terminase small subunit